jgi:tRNA A-37 threonylcarbamoyl transferase component Bud32
LDKSTRASETEVDMRRRERVVIAPDWQTLLRTHQLDSVAAVYALQTGATLKHGSATELRHLEFREDGVRRELYLKKYWYPTFAHRWSGSYRGTLLGVSKVRREFENLARLRAWGLDAPAPVAYGEERSAGWLLRSFLISEGVHNPLPLDLFIRDHLPTIPSSEQQLLRRTMITSLADYTCRMHEHSFVHHDYFWRNILLSGTSPARFFPIDSHKGRCWKSWLELRSRAKDLATLDAPAPSFFRRGERLRFFLRYRGHPHLTGDDKHLLRLILRLAEPMRSAQRQRVRQAKSRSESVKDPA